MKRSVFAAVIVFVCSCIAFAASGNRVLYCKPVDCSGCAPGAWVESTSGGVSLSDRDLLATTPGATAVLKFDPTTNMLYRWNGSACHTVLQTGMLGTGTLSQPLGPTLCSDGSSNTCFCVPANDPTGYFFVTAAPGAFQIWGGPSATVPGTLNGPGTAGSLDGTNVVIAPACAGITDAKALMDAIGFANVTSVSRYIKASNAFQTYTGRKNGGLAFPIDSATAYFVKVQTTSSYWPACAGPATPIECPGGQRLFGIVGNADLSSTVAWELQDASGAHVCGFSNPSSTPLPSLGTSADIAKTIVDGVTNPAYCDRTEVTAFTDTNSSFFSVAAVGTTTGPLKLLLGTGGTPPSCTVDSGSPCTFNPTVSDAGCAGHPNGTACNDGLACTLNDTCQAGTCTGSYAPNGTGCNDGNACTLTDTCQSGGCVGTGAVVCGAPDQCHDAATCVPATGCTYPPKPNGTSCSDGTSCTPVDTCQSGACVGTSVICCSGVPDGTACGGGATCNAGLCRLPAALPALSTTAIAALMLLMAAGLAIWHIRRTTA
jgi:hypothetical protein